MKVQFFSSIAILRFAEKSVLMPVISFIMVNFLKQRLIVKRNLEFLKQLKSKESILSFEINRNF